MSKQTKEQVLNELAETLGTLLAHPEQTTRVRKGAERVVTALDFLNKQSDLWWRQRLDRGHTMKDWVEWGNGEAGGELEISGRNAPNVACR